MWNCSEKPPLHLVHVGLSQLKVKELRFFQFYLCTGCVNMVYLLEIHSKCVLLRGKFGIVLKNPFSSQA